MNDYSLCTYVIGRNNPQTRSVNMLGTGFLVGQKIITSLHVVNGDDQNLCIIAPHIGNIEVYQDVENTQCTAFPLVIKEADPIKDICVMECSVNFHLSPDISTWGLGSLDDVCVGERLGIWGFPHCVEGRRVLTYQEAELGAKLLMATSGIKSKYGTINIQTRPGQSGSPVYSKTSGRVVGILVGAYAPECGIRLGNINPYELNQTSYCLSAEYLHEML